MINSFSRWFIWISIRKVFKIATIGIIFQISVTSAFADSDDAKALLAIGDTVLYQDKDLSDKLINSDQTRLVPNNYRISSIDDQILLLSYKWLVEDQKLYLTETEKRSVTKCRESVPNDFPRLESLLDFKVNRFLKNKYGGDVVLTLNNLLPRAMDATVALVKELEKNQVLKVLNKDTGYKILANFCNMKMSLEYPRVKEFPNHPACGELD